MTQKEWEKAHYERLKAEHKCAKCHVQDERTLSGKTLCEVCAEIQRVFDRKKASIKKNDGLEIKPKRKSTLAQHIKEANARGMSYGKYVAMIGGKMNENY